MNLIIKLARILYSSYTLVVFLVSFLLLAPLFLTFVQNKKWHKHALALNRVWAYFFFPIIFISIKKDIRFKPEKWKTYVFCPNHFSYLDIPTVVLIPHNFIFVGKNSMEKIPLFGYMYRKLHITVDRSSLRSKYDTLIKAKNYAGNTTSLKN